MTKKSATHFLVLFYAMLLWGNGDCFGGNGTSFSTLTASSTSVGDEQRPTDHNTIGKFSGVSLPSACLNSETNGSRQLSSTQGRLVLLVRLLGGNAHIARGWFGRVDEIRSLYGLVRPHLYFCRLLI